jgi:hypothetical protein
VESQTNAHLISDQLNRRSDIKNIGGKGTYEWKSATMALSPSGMGMNSWPAPLMMVRGTYDFDTRTVVNKRSVLLSHSRVVMFPLTV